MPAAVNIILALLPLPFLVYVANPAIALLAGIVVTLILNRDVAVSFMTPKWVSKNALQTAIVLLGFGLPISRVVEISADYSFVVSAYVLLTIALGLALGLLFRAEKESSQLVSAGTAICGGTAVASLSPLVGARADQTAVTIAVIFLLNSVALFSFPWIGEYFQLTQNQFGLWCALAIHDTSSVVATSAIYGEEALEVATTVKLGRTLWLIPLMLAVSLLNDVGATRLRIPGFILLFLVASGVGSLVPMPEILLGGASLLSKALLVVALYFVGFEIKREVVKTLKGRAVAQGLLLWLIIVPATLYLVIALYE